MNETLLTIKIVFIYLLKTNRCEFRLQLWYKGNKGTEHIMNVEHRNKCNR